MTFGLPAGDQWQHVIENVLRSGQHVIARNYNTIEDVGVASHIDMRYPVVNVNLRATKGYARFLPTEAYWILTGSQLLSGVTRAAPSFKNYSDNGYTLQGAYGPRVVEQLSYVLDVLREDRQSRQAVMEIWRPNPRKSADVPCTLSLQFLLRNNKVHLIVTMRSSDLWLGWPFDVFSFSMIAAWVALHLRHLNVIDRTWELGTLKLTAGSQHIYERNLEKATVASIARQPEDYWTYRAMSLSDFNHPDQLVIHLGFLAKCHYAKCKSPFMAELKELRAREA